MFESGTTGTDNYLLLNVLGLASKLIKYNNIEIISSILSMIANWPFISCWSMTTNNFSLYGVDLRCSVLEQLPKLVNKQLFYNVVFVRL